MRPPPLNTGQVLFKPSSLSGGPGQRSLPLLETAGKVPQTLPVFRCQAEPGASVFVFLYMCLSEDQLVHFTFRVREFLVKCGQTWLFMERTGFQSQSWGSAFS